MDQAIPSVEGFPYLVKTQGPEGTAELGRKAASLLVGGEIILLYGDLGAGKTCFAQGLCKGLDVEDEVVSPTFTLVNTYRGRLKVHHLDFYRIEPQDDLGDIGVPDILDEVWDGNSVALIEWPAVLLPELGSTSRHLELVVLPGESPLDRRWYFRGVPAAPDPWIELFDQGADQC